MLEKLKEFSDNVITTSDYTPENMASILFDKSSKDENESNEPDQDMQEKLSNVDSTNSQKADREKRPRKRYSIYDKAKILQRYYEFVEKNGEASTRIMERELGVPRSVIQKTVCDQHHIVAKVTDNDLKYDLQHHIRVAMANKKAKKKSESQEISEDPFKDVSIASEENCELEEDEGSSMETSSESYAAARQNDSSNDVFASDPNKGDIFEPQAMLIRKKDLAVGEDDFTTQENPLKVDSSIKRSNRRYNCENCNFNSGWKAKLDRHIEIMHNTIKEFMCSSCDYVYTHDYDLKQHIRRHHKDSKKSQSTERDSEGKRSRKKYSFAERASIIQSLQEYIDKNGQTSYRALEVKFGVPSSNLSKWVQNKEQILAKAADNPNSNKLSHQWFSCEECNFRTGWNSALQRHVIEMHGTAIDIRCPNCPYRSTNAEDLKKHIKKAHKEGEKCKLCGFQPKSQEALTQHILTKHIEPKVEKVEDGWVDCSLDIAPKVAYDEPENQDDWDEEDKYDNSVEGDPVSCFEAKDAIVKLKKFLLQSEIGENGDIESMTLSDMSAFVNARTTISSLKKSLNFDKN